MLDHDKHRILEWIGQITYKWPFTHCLVRSFTDSPLILQTIGDTDIKLNFFLSASKYDRYEQCLSVIHDACAARSRGAAEYVH